MQKFWASIAMLVATVIWGTAFSAQSESTKYVDALLFVALRSFVGTGALCLVIMFFDLVKEKKLSFWGNAGKTAKKDLLLGGLFCGIAITSASFCQQLGIKYISAGKTGFLTALYILIVPFLGLFLKRKTPFPLYIASGIALAGTYLLCGGIQTVGKGEFFVILCAFLYAGHIMVIDHYAAKCDCIRLSCVQFAAATVFSVIASLLAGERWCLSGITASLPFWIFCGVGSSAIAFTLQIAAQKYLHPVTATLLMSLESVFAVAGGYLFLQEKLSGRELAGCCIILIATILAQIPWKKKENLRKEKNC
ncbi:MAG: DMT family transporter [Lentisphaeria bacterium]|nr:DMT family transporter [Lentisphaeria bacterium]